MLPIRYCCVTLPRLFLRGTDSVGRVPVSLVFFFLSPATYRTGFMCGLSQGVGGNVVGYTAAVDATDSDDCLWSPWRGCVCERFSALRQLVCACAVLGVVGKRALRKAALVVVAVAVKNNNSMNPIGSGSKTAAPAPLPHLSSPTPSEPSRSCLCRAGKGRSLRCRGGGHAEPVHIVLVGKLLRNVREKPS